jgi:hypothetical protein
VSEGVYPNGMPHPPAALRIRVAVELGVLALLTALFLWLVPHDGNTQTQFIYVGMAIAGLGLIGFTAKETEERIWGPVESPPFDRVRRCAINMSALTIPPVVLFFIFGILARYFNWAGIAEAMNGSYTGTSMISFHFLIVLAVYLPWALLQQTLFQFYLLGRFRALLPWASPFHLSVLNGIIYGLCSGISLRC